MIAVTDVEICKEKCGMCEHRGWAWNDALQKWVVCPTCGGRSNKGGCYEKDHY